MIRSVQVYVLALRSVQVYVLCLVSTGLRSLFGQYRSTFLIWSVQAYVLDQVSTGLRSCPQVSTGLLSLSGQYRSTFFIWSVQVYVLALRSACAAPLLPGPFDCYSSVVLYVHSYRILQSG